MATEQTRGQEVPLPRLDAYYWAAALIWMGLIFGADSLGILPQVDRASPWTWIFIGGGLTGFALSFYSLSSPDYATPTTWDYIWSGLLLILGLGSLTPVNISWPLILVLAGMVYLGSALLRRD